MVCGGLHLIIHLRVVFSLDMNTMNIDKQSILMANVMLDIVHMSPRYNL